MVDTNQINRMRLVNVELTVMEIDFLCQLARSADANRLAAKLEAAMNSPQTSD